MPNTTATIGKILKTIRHNRGLTLADMAKLLGASNQRVYQWESGENIPLNRIREWLQNPDLPHWAHEMAYQVWIITLQDAHEQLGVQITELRAYIQA